MSSSGSTLANNDNTKTNGYGFLYVMTNRLMPDIVKIGQTERHPIARAAELSSGSGVPEPFEVACFYEVMDRFAAEKHIHAALDKQRVQSGREFFSISVDEARSLIGDILFQLESFPSALIRPEITLKHIRKASDYCQKCRHRLDSCQCKK